MFIYDDLTHLDFSEYIPVIFTLIINRIISSLCWLTRTVKECKERPLEYKSDATWA